MKEIFTIGLIVFLIGLSSAYGGYRVQRIEAVIALSWFSALCAIVSGMSGGLLLIMALL